jgi:hypothetical protein
LKGNGKISWMSHAPVGAKKMMMIISSSLESYHILFAKYDGNQTGHTEGLIKQAGVHFFFQLAGWDFGYCGHYWPIVPAPDDT